VKTKVMLAVLAAAAAVPASAAAHVTIAPGEAPADDYQYVQFSVGHGCDESPTTRLRIQIPENVPSATPQIVPGWEVTTKTGPKEEFELHGETITEGPSELIWTAKDEPLPDGRLQLFGASLRLPAQPGETIYFPAIQECEQGKTRWIQIPAEGQSPDDLEEPAPALVLTDAEGGGHGGDAEPAEAETEAKADDPDSGSDGLAIAGLVVGGLGLLTGGAALARTRRG